MVLGPGPEGEPVLERPGEVVARVRVDSLEQAKADPDVLQDEQEVNQREGYVR